MISIDGSTGEGGGQILRTALSLAAATGRSFEITKIRAGRSRPGLRPQHVAAVRAASMACQARVSGLYEGSLALKFEPGAIVPGDFHFEIGTAGATTLVLQTVIPALAGAQASSSVALIGGTHVPASPSFHYLQRHWLPVVGQAGLLAQANLVTAGFYPRGGGAVRCAVQAWKDRNYLELDQRGALLSVHGVSAATRLKHDVARRQKDAAQRLVWESQRLEVRWDSEDVAAPSPGSFIQIEAVFERGRAAFCGLGERGLRAEVLGERVARSLLAFLDAEGAIDPHLADQLVVPMALGGGGRITTTAVTRHLVTVVWTVSLFGFEARLWGATAEPGIVEVGRP